MNGTINEGKTRFGNLTTFYSLIYISAAILLIGLLLIFSAQPEAGLIFLAIGFILLIIAMIFFYMILYQVWNFTIAKENDFGISPSIPTAGKAVGYLFIPIFNFYWLFKGIGKLPNDINSVAKRLELNKFVPDNLGYGIALLSLIGLIPYVGYVTAVINLLVLLPLFIKSCVEVCKLIDTSEKIPEKKISHLGKEKISSELFIGIQTAVTNRFGSMQLYWGFLYSGLFVALVGLSFILSDEEEAGVFILIIGIAIAFVGIFYFYVLLFRVWKFVIFQSKMKGLSTSIETHREAVGFLFIPLYSFYWVFIGIGKLPKDLNALAKSYDINNIISQNLAYGIGILSVISIIPYMGIVTSAIAIFVLQPLLIYRSIQLSELIIDEKKLHVDVRSNYEPIKNYWESLTEFSKLFNVEEYGINYFVGIGLFTGLLLNRILWLILSGLFDLYYYSAFEYHIVGLGIDIINCLLFVILINFFSKNQLLPFIWGIIIVLTSIASIAFIRQTFQVYYSDSDFTSIFNPGFLINNFLTGFTFMLGFYYSIKIWGAKAWSLILGLVSGYIIYKIFNIIIVKNFYTPEYYLDLSSYELIAILNKIVVGATLYFGFYFYFKQPKFQSILTDQFK